MDGDSMFGEKRAEAAGLENLMIQRMPGVVARLAEMALLQTSMLASDQDSNAELIEIANELDGFLALYRNAEQMKSEIAGD